MPKISQSEKEQITANFGENLKRVRNLVRIYTVTTPSIQGRKTVKHGDILRAAIVLLHASLEEFLRAIALWKWQGASKEVLDKVRFVDGKGTRNLHLDN